MNSSLLRLSLLFVAWIFSGQILRADAVAPPVLQLQAGETATEFDVWVTSGTATAVIRYTLNGKEPTVSDSPVPASGIVNMNGNVVFKAKAWDGAVPSVLTPSATTTAVYNGFGRVAGGTAETFTLTFDGRIGGAGANYNGTLGNGTTAQANTPVWAIDNAAVLRQVISVDGSASTSSTVDFTLAAKSDGTVWAWGGNSSGQLGIGTTSSGVSSPVQVLKGASLPLTQIISVAAGTTSGYALDAQGSVWAWGSNTYGQLGDGTTTARSYAALVKTDTATTLSGIIAISAGSNHLLALDATGRVWTVGRGTEKQLGDGGATNRPFAAKVVASGAANDDLTNVAHVAGLGHSSMIVRTDGTVWGWGVNTNGWLGDGTTTAPSYPVKMQASSGVDFSGAKALAGGTSHTLILKTDGTVWAAGNNTNGVLGDGTTTNALYPVQVRINSNTILANIVEVAAGPALRSMPAKVRIA